jgi:hypothetical protein
MINTYTHSISLRLARGHWVALAALTLLFGCGAPGADVAPSGSGEQPAASSDTVDSPSSTAASEETAPLGVGNATLSAADKAPTTAAELDAVATTNHVSGERIQARMMVTSDGQLTALGWHDSELGEDCAFQRDAEGTLRCFPVNGSEQLYYSNPECSRGFVTSDDAAVSSPNYYYYRKNTACGEGIRAYDVAEEGETLTTVYMRTAQGCVAVEAAGRSFHALEAPIDPARFVAAEYGTIASSYRVKGYGLIAEDGAISITHFIDSELDTPCMWTGSDTTVCAPQGSIVDRFADPEMSVPLLKDEAPNCDDPLITMGSFEADGISRYYRRGERFEGDTVYGVVPQMINGAAAIPAHEVYYQAEEVPANRLAQGSVSSDVSSRLNPVFWNTDDGDSWFSHWYDLALGSNCTFAADGADGALCLPDTTGSRVVYTDAACDRPVAEVDANCGGERPQFAKEYPNGEHPNAPVNVRRLIIATSLQSVYESTDAGCVSHQARADKHYFGLSEPLPAAAFVSATLASKVSADQADTATDIGSEVR